MGFYDGGTTSSGGGGGGFYGGSSAPTVSVRTTPAKVQVKSTVGPADFEKVRQYFLAQQKAHKPGRFERLMTGAKKDIVGMVTGVPSLVSLVAKGAATPAVGIYAKTPLPGARGAQGTYDRWMGQGTRAVGGVGEAYSHQYGPLLRGDIKTFLDRANDHPVNVLLDFMGAGAAAGKLAGAGAKAGARAGLGREGGIIERMAATGADSPHLARSPRVVELPASDELGSVASRVEVDRGLMSRNPLYREFVQRPVTQPVRDSVHSGVQRAVDALLGEQPSGLAKGTIGKLSSKAAYERVAAGRARDLQMRASDRAKLATATGLDDFYKGVRQLDASVGARLAKLAGHVPGVKRVPGVRTQLESAGRAERDAMMLHAYGLLDMPGFASPRANLEAIVSWQQRGLDAAHAAGKKTALSRRQVERFKRLPDELLSYDTLPPHLKDAVDTARATISESQRKNVESGFITEATAEGVRGRAARELVGGEEDVSHLMAPAQAERVAALTGEIKAARGRARALTAPAPRADALATVNEVKRHLADAQKFKGRKTKQAQAAIDAAERKLRDLEETTGARLPAPKGDATVYSRPEAAPAMRELEELNRRLDVLHRAAQQPVRRMAHEITPQRTGGAGLSVKFGKVDEYIPVVEQMLQRDAKAMPAEMRTLDEMLADQSSLGRAPTRGGKHTPMSRQRIKQTVEKSMLDDGFGKRPLVTRIMTGERAQQVAERARVWDEEYTRRSQAVRAADAERLTHLTDAEAVSQVKQVLESAGRRDPAQAAKKVAALMRHRVDALGVIRQDRRARLRAAVEAETKRPGAKTSAATRRASAEAAIADRAYRIAVEERLAGAEPAVRAEAIERGLIGHDAPSTNPRVILPLLDERSQVLDRIRELEAQVGKASAGDVFLGDVTAEPVTAASARALRDRSAVTGEAGGVPAAQAARGRRQAARMFSPTGGPGDAARTEIAQAQFTKQAVRGGFQPQDVTARVSELQERLAEAETSLGIARSTEVGTRPAVDAARSEVKALKRQRALVSSRDAIDARVAKLEQRVASGKVTDAEMAELSDLRGLQAGTRSTPAAPELRDTVPGIREFVQAAMERNPRVATVSPEVDALPAVVSAQARTSAAVEKLTAALDEFGTADPAAYAKRVDAAQKEVEQAYYLEREARLAGAKEVHGVEFKGNPAAEHIAAQPLDKFQARPAAAIQILRGPIVPKTAKAGRASLVPSGNFRIDPALVTEQRFRAEVALQHPQLVHDMLDGFAARDAGGKLVRGDRVLAMMRANPDDWIPVSQASLEKAFAKLDNLDTGQLADTQTVNSVLHGGRDEFFEGGGSDLKWRRGPDGKRVIGAKDVYLLPRVVAKEWAEAMRPKRIPYYDSLLDGWKAGMLAFHPRWYVYNLVGNTFQYMLMSGGDVRSIRDTMRYRQKLGAALGDVGADVRMASLARDVGLEPGMSTGVLRKIADAGFGFNDRLEGLIRDAAMVSRTRTELKSAGKLKRGDSVDAMVDAIGNLPADSPIIREAARTTTLFMGEYRRFNTFERAVLRRVFPFYSWLRVITKLTASLPFKAPIRSELLSIGTQLAFESMTDEEQFLENLRPLWDRGGVGVPGTDIVVRTTSANPLSTVAPYVDALGNRSANEFVAALAPSITPPFSAAVAAAAGKSVLGQRDFTAPAGYNDTVPVYGRDPLYRDPATGRIETADPAKPPLLESLAQSTIPFYGSALRSVAAGEKKPYDTASTPALIANRLFGIGDASQLFKKPSAYQTSSPVGPGGIMTVLGSEAGLPIRHRDTNAEIALMLKLMTDYQKAQISLARRRARDAASGN